MGTEHETWATDVLKYIGVDPNIPAPINEEDPETPPEQSASSNEETLKAEEQAKVNPQEPVNANAQDKVEEAAPEKEQVEGKEEVEAQGQSKPEDVPPVDEKEPVPDLVLPEDGSLQEAKDVMAIAEREVGCAEREIKFTGFSSCIGVTVRDGTKVKGVHLALIKPDGNPFNKDDAAKVLTSLGTYSEAMIFGQIVFWKNPANQVADAFKVLEEGLKAGATKEDGYKDFQFDDGEYGAEITEDDDFFPTF
ncbi:hypothetical protein [Pseudovibrio brasiliensis]|uniref:Uncharacterized protein n=1 Tax=Pseudovibrio brasiliensis TaxID=1898042 RepID=A0ABX8AGZ5_9HYPH|nr:hypothetical protein [Pseudovibrio brasiliensis]QUS54350.1 hypothetical protein KGB56_13175 [Pseudovibrio brasiliensis]